MDDFFVLAYEQGLSEGLKTERRLFHMTFATADQKEGAWNILYPSARASLDLPSDIGE
jgi:hypothetical protein